MDTAESWLPTADEFNAHMAAIRERFGNKPRESAYGVLVSG